MHYDHDFFKGEMGNLQIFDNTNYPKTLDPLRTYTQNDEIVSQEILGLRNDQMAGSLLQFECLMYHDPVEKLCPLQGDMYDKLVKLNLSSIKLNYLQEYLLRINDYFLNQFLAALSDADPYQKLIQNLLNEEKHSSYQKNDRKRSSFSFKSMSSFDDNEEPVMSKPDTKSSIPLANFGKDPNLPGIENMREIPVT